MFGGMSSDSASKNDELSKIGRFIQTYSSFLSSFVIGVAGLVATSIWQYRQSQTAARQAESEQTIARTKADNDWRIARAEILAKNLNILSAQGPQTADQRFGVLLSLTRGNILDPELAVSYALELGKDNATYMRSVLASTSNKNYIQLEQAFALTCLQRFGVERAAEICKDDRLAERSDAISQLLSDELEAAVTAGTFSKGPMTLLADEHEVQLSATKLSWLFEPYLQDLYERRQWTEINRFEAFSAGARLVSALVLATARTGELVTAGQQAMLEKFHSDRRKWLVDHMFGNSCDAECRGKLVQTMLSSYGEAEGDYDDAFRRLLLSPRGENGPAFASLHARLLWCQVDGDDLAQLRDAVLVPALGQALEDPKVDPAQLDDLAALVALAPEPTPPQPGATDPASAHIARTVTAWHNLLSTLDKHERAKKTFASRKQTARRERTNPPPMIKKINFCTAAAAPQTQEQDL